MDSWELSIVEVEYGSQQYAAMVAMRQRLLREPLGLRFSRQELAADSDSHHLAALVDEELVGCAVLRPCDRRRLQMCQLVVRPEFQRRGIGAALVAHAEALARRLGFVEMALHARQPAIGFYERLGYQKHGEPFVHVTIVHQRMTKDLCERPVDGNDG